jgi:Zn2+/Cd2+-exporting ATPase
VAQVVKNGCGCSAQIRTDKVWDVQTSLTFLCGLMLVLAFVPGWGMLAFASIACGSYFALRSAYASLSHRRIDVNFLMVLAAAGAIAVGHPHDAAALLFLFSLSSTLEARAMARTRSAIEGLIKLRPEEAVLVLPDGDRRIRVEDLQVGDRIRVLPYENVPADAVVVEGESSADEAAMTGESAAVAKTPGDRLLAGTQNLDGMLLARVEARVGDSTLDRVVELVRDAQENKATGERISAWFGQRYTLFVVGVFLVSLILRGMLGGVWSDALAASITLLVALSPCAIVISTPASTLSALTWAARNGILVRGGDFVERAGLIQAVALDKTGTLTRGAPSLTEICVCVGERELVSAGPCREEQGCWHDGGPMSDNALRALRFAAAAEQYSTHPIAEAIVSAAREASLDVPEARNSHVHGGLGVSAQIDGVEVRVGQRRFFESEEERLPEAFVAHVENLQSRGMTVAILRFGETYAALGLRDAVRPEAKAFVRSLREAGVQRIVMMTGDTRQTAEAVAAEVGIDEVHAGLMPGDKTALVEELERSGHRTMMVGDGVNDAPSLARASMGVAMGGLGSDVALNAADVVLMHDRLERLPQLMRLGRKANRIIQGNLLFAGGVVVALAVASLLIHLPLYVAVIGHEGSTVVVILSGLRLLRGP